MPGKAKSKRGKQGGKAKAAGKSKQATKMDAFVEGFKTFEKKRAQCEAQEVKYHLTDAEIERLPTVTQAIAAIAEAEAQRARREALDAKTGGQYGALCELADAFAAVLETKESQEVFTWDEYPDPASAAKDFVSELEGRPQRVVKAREALLRTGYAVPDEWLVVDVDFAIHRPKPPPQFALTPPRSGAWRVYWCAVRDPAALDRCLRQVRVAILRFEHAPAGQAKGGASMSKPVSVTLAVVDRMVELVQELDRACTPPPLPPMKQRDPKLWRRALEEAKEERAAAFRRAQAGAIHCPGGRPVRETQAEARARCKRAGRQVLENAESKYRRTDTTLWAETKERRRKAKALSEELAELFLWHGPALERLSGLGKRRAEWYADAAAPQGRDGLRAGIVEDLARIRLKLEDDANVAAQNREVLPALMGQVGRSGSLPASGRKAAQAASPENGNRRRNKCTTSHPKRGKRHSPTPRTDGYELFYSFSTKDESLRSKLETHLTMLKRENLIREWHFQKIPPGTAFKGEIDKHLNTASIILLLVSADFLASDYCYTIEMKRAIERHKKGSAVVIPIILRECDWDKAPFAGLQALPKNAKPVTSWRDKDKAFTDIAKGIRRTIESLKSEV